MSAWRYVAPDRWSLDCQRYALVVEETQGQAERYLAEAVWLTGAVAPIGRYASLDVAQVCAEEWSRKYERALRPKESQ